METGKGVSPESKMASTSMVELSLNHAYSDQRLDQDCSMVEENQLKSGKSQSVPRLALLSVGQDDQSKLCECECVCVCE